MSRTKGTAIFAVNIEPTGQSPLDARLVVEDFAELIASETYSEDNNYYKGMTVTVNHGDSGHSEIWTLVDTSKITSKEGWERKDADAAQIATNLDNAIKGLKNDDAAIDGQFVTAATQANGVVSVTREAVAADKVTATAIAGDATKVAVAGTNVKAQIESLASTLKTVEKNAAKYEVVKLTNDEIQALTDADKANIKEAYKLVSYVGDSATAEKTQVGSTIKIYKDGNLKSAKLGEGADAQKLILTYTTADGTDAEVKVDFAAIAFNTEFKDGLVVAENGEVKVKLADDSQSFLTVGADGLKLSGVQGAIANVADTAVAGKYVSKVSQSSGKIAVERASIADAPLSGYAKGTDKTAVAATDTINKAIGKLENQVADAVAQGQTVVKAATDSGLEVTSTSGADGHIEYTVNTDDTLAKSADLTKEIADRKNADTAIEDKIGEVPEGKNIIGIIEENELVTANAFDKVKAALGITGEVMAYEKVDNDIIGAATSYKDADTLLAQKIAEILGNHIIDCGTY